MWEQVVNRLEFALAMVVILSLALFLLPVPAESSVDSVIYIRPNGDVEGTDKIQRNGNVYTLTGDISASVNFDKCLISVERGNIILDGAGRTIQGGEWGVGVHLRGRSNVVVKNLKIIGFGTGIGFDYLPQTADENPLSVSSNNQILNNEITASYWGIDAGTNDSLISGNIFTSTNPKYGINFWCNNTVFSNNRFVGGGIIMFKGVSGNTFSNNTVNGKPLVYVEGGSNQVIDGAGQVFLLNCHNMVVKNVHPATDLRVGIVLSGTTNIEVTNCSTRISLRNSHSNMIHENHLSGITSVYPSNSAIELSGSNNNTIMGNTITDIDGSGISLSGSANNVIHGNVILSVSSSGISLGGTYSVETFNTRFNSIYENNLTNCQTGILLSIAKSNAICKNNILGSERAISLYSAHETIVLGNNILVSSELGIALSASDDNTFHHNNLIKNTRQATEAHHIYAIPDMYYSKNNKWDDGREGNYWSNYTGNDANGDGIGDTPHNIQENHTDHYPLMNPVDLSIVTLDLPEWPLWAPSESSNQTSEPNPSSPLEELHISILSPQNETYNTTDVPLVFTVSKQVGWMGYSLDSQTNTSITGNTTVIGLPAGSHNLTVYANSTAGDFVASETISFTIAESSEQEPVPIMFIVAVSGTSIALAGVGTLLYLRKRKR